MDNTTIQKFLDEHDYDIRKTHNGRWIDVLLERKKQLRLSGQK